MFKGKFIKVSLLVSVIAISIISTSVPGISDKMRPELDVPYEPTHPSVVSSMLSVANVSKGDVLYDLGCGDGRIVVMATRKFGAARAVGIDLDPQRLLEAQERAKAYGVLDKIRFVQGNIMEVDASPATVVTMYLLDSVNLMVRPKLFMELRPGTRCVAHAFHMTDWKQDKIVQHPKARNNRISYWVIPAHLGGSWKWETTTPAGNVAGSMKIMQKFQRIKGTINFDGSRDTAIDDPFVDGKNVSFTSRVNYKGQGINVEYKGVADGDVIRGTQEWKGGPHSGKFIWVAKREASNVYGTWEVSLQGGRAPLDGVLTLARKGRKLVASYYVKGEGRDERISQIYVWGNSVYFRVPLFGRESVAVFSGNLSGDKGEGSVKSKTWGAAVYNWTARKTR